MKDGADNMSRPSDRTKQNRRTRDASRPLHKNMVRVPGGTFLMGSNDFYSEERSVHRVAVDGFWMDAHPVTNAEFRCFVKATAYVTVAERLLDPADYPDTDNRSDSEPSERLSPRATSSVSSPAARRRCSGSARTRWWC
jgi:formylglycine-generating enzyme required for sulfatase activity